jgi:hypothetical protein
MRKAGGLFAWRSFIAMDKKASARLWILDTIVTAAPLLGLLDTIFGIMETFNALAAGGVPDPAAVSRGTGTALVAYGHRHRVAQLNRKLCAQLSRAGHDRGLQGLAADLTP